MPSGGTVLGGVMLNIYPDSLGGDLAGAISLLEDERLNGAFSGIYILPSVFNSDLDRGFSVIDYSLNRVLCSERDLQALKALGLWIKFDFVINHASILSSQFQDLVAKGAQSEYADFFIDWNKFWEGKGEKTSDGYVMPEERWMKGMFFRKPGLPILEVPFPDGSIHWYWNTFYQKVEYPPVDTRDLMRCLNLQYMESEILAASVNAQLAEGKRTRGLQLGKWESRRDELSVFLEKRKKALGQMDLNIRSEKAWEYYADTLRILAEYGARIVRLDAFAYAAKSPGAKNFLNEPETWDLLERVDGLAEEWGVELLPEIHAPYSQRVHEAICGRGYLAYDFFLPGLILHAIETGDCSTLRRWGEETARKNLKLITMLGCHDGIPLLDLKGLLPEEEIGRLIKIIVNRGGCIKDLHGKTSTYYQVNATFFSALGEDPAKMIMARAVQLMMPGLPQVWYLDLFAGKNDLEAVARGGADAHKEINRTNLSAADIRGRMLDSMVQRQIELIRMRNSHPAFCPGAKITFLDSPEDTLRIHWERSEHYAEFSGDFRDMSFSIDLS
jgi:sucrose phosphorylase